MYSSLIITSSLHCSVTFDQVKDEKRALACLGFVYILLLFFSFLAHCPPLIYSIYIVFETGSSTPRRAFLRGIACARRLSCTSKLMERLLWLNEMTPDP